MNSIYVFCYGSNLLMSRIRARCASVTLIGTGYIISHALKFHMHSTDGSGKADAYKTSNPEDLVWGTVISISKVDKLLLDGHEDLGSAYNEKEITVWLQDDLQTKAWIYVACSNRIKAHLKPYCWYHRFVLEGARESGLPDEYIATIDAVVCYVDKDDERRSVNQV